MSEARRLKALETENAKLKKLLAEAHLDNTGNWLRRIRRPYESNVSCVMPALPWISSAPAQGAL